MKHRQRVVWSEGMFLRPQHFQQQERYFDFVTQQRMASLSGLYWGFRQLELDVDALALGSVAIRKASGVLPDGTPFVLPDHGELPPAFDVPANARNIKVCLALPPLRDGGESVIFDEDAGSAARYAVDVLEAQDTNAFGAGGAEIQVCRSRFRLMDEAEVPHGWHALGVVMVVERLANNVVRLEREYIPPFLSCGYQEVLASYVREITGLLHQRGEALAGRLSAPGRGGVSEVSDFLVLALVNRWQPLFSHLGHLEVLHPERLYSDVLRLAGELASFPAGTRRPARYPAYDQDDLQTTFRPVMRDLRQALSIVLEQTAIQIDLQERKYGIRMAVVPDRELLKGASFVLAAHANLPSDQMQQQFPAQVKIGPVEKIRDLVNLHLPGVVLRPLPVAPRELPYHAGYNYFELDTHHDLWRELERSAGIAVHIAGDFPNLNLECWAIRK